MNTETIDRPNLPEAAPIENSVASLDQIAAKMAAMRNQTADTKQTETGSSGAATLEAPVAPDGVEVPEDNNTTSIEPEVAETSDTDVEPTAEAADAPEQVSTDSTAADVIDFLEFAEQNPDAKFKFKRNGKEIMIDAKKAAAILGQGGAIHEEARQLKIERADFDEYVKEQRAKQDGLILAMEFTVKPQLQRAYDEILRTQQYQTVFQQQLSQTQDPAQQAKIQASMQQNERYIAQQSEVVRQLKPNLDQFYDIRREQVREVIENSRKAFKDKELRNEYVFKEIRDKVAKDWDGAHRQLVPGVDNIDLISSDEHLLSLIRDGLKYRDKPASKSAGGSIAALTTKRGTQLNAKSGDEDIGRLREQAKSGDKKAADNLLVAQLSRLRAARTGR